MRHLLVVMLACAACSNRTEVDLTVNFASSFDPATIQKIDSLHVKVVGDRQPFYTQVMTVHHELDGHEGRVVYLPGIDSGTLTFSADAFAGDMQVGSGEGTPTVEVHAGSASPLTITIDPYPGASGTDLGVADLAGSDLAVGDLASSDLAGVDLKTIVAPCDAGLLCESFEVPDTASLSQWAVHPQSGTITIDKAGGANGTPQSVACTLPGTPTGYAQVDLTANQRFNALPVYVRFFARRTGTSPSDQSLVLTYGSGSDSIDVQLDSGSVHAFQVATAGATSYTNATTMTLGSTFDCYELRVTAMSANLFQNKLEIASVQYAAKTFASAQLQLIVSGTQAGADYTVEFDEVLVATTPNLCP